MSAPGFEYLVEQVRLTPFQENGWNRLVEAAVIASGGWCGQLIGVRHDGRVFMHLAPRVPEEAAAAFEAAGGSDPVLNPRARVLASPTTCAVRDSEVVTEETRRRSPFIAEFCKKFEADYSATAKLVAPGGASVVLASIRSGRQGDFSDEQFSAFRRLLPHVEAAMRLQLSLEEQGNSVALGALEAIRAPAFLLNAAGALMAATPMGEAVLRKGGVLRLRDGALEPTHRADARSFERALIAAAQPSTTASTTVPLHYNEVGYLSAEIARLPAPPAGARFGAVLILVLPPSPKPRAQALELIAVTLDLTPAEAEVALLISEGEPVDEIAARRAVQPETIRTQLKRIYAKANVSSQLQLSVLTRNVVGPTSDFWA